MNRINKNKGFSLVELIVAITTLAILSGLLVPTYIHLLKKSEIDKDEVKFESVCTAFKRAMGEAEVQKELEEIGGNEIKIALEISDSGLIEFESGNIVGEGTVPMENSALWLNSYQSTTMTYTTESDTFWGKRIVFTLTPKTDTTTAKCSYEILDSAP